MSEEEAAAAERMLRCAYSGRVNMDGGATAEELLSTMVLADRCGLEKGWRWGHGGQD